VTRRLHVHEVAAAREKAVLDLLAEFPGSDRYDVAAKLGWSYSIARYVLISMEKSGKIEQYAPGPTNRKLQFFLPGAAPKPPVKPATAPANIFAALFTQ